MNSKDMEMAKRIHEKEDTELIIRRIAMLDYMLNKKGIDPDFLMEFAAISTELVLRQLKSN